MEIVKKIDGLLQSTRSYFAYSPKQHLEFVKLSNMMEACGLKMFHNVKTH